MAPLSAHPPSIQTPTQRNTNQTSERKPAVLLDTRERDGGAGTEDLEHVDDGVLDAGEARALCLGYEGLRQLLRREVEDPDTEARKREE
ncbi:hypothetical protein RRF57_009544 [Xylaria bambusicola]|uniref:Uncharacterized protein n=1 Tax=Xylaria bambusicola TaxID=326684 RepID=A0AAN7Z1R3_9PEZI